MCVVLGNSFRCNASPYKIVLSILAHTRHRCCGDHERAITLYSRSRVNRAILGTSTEGVSGVQRVGRGIALGGALSVSITILLL
jgi:hypothetical protein